MRYRLRLFAAVAVAGLAAAPALGFYFPGWPGSGEPRPRTLIPPDLPREANPPSANPPLTVGEPPGGPPPDTERPSQAPEPGTLTAALLGLAAVGARFAARRKKK